MEVFSPSTQDSPIQWRWVTLMGPDAQDFLQRLTTVNLRQLEPGQGAPGCFLNPQGKIQAYFTLWNYGQDLTTGEYAFEFEAGSQSTWTADLISWIDKYTFAEKITAIDPSSELECYWLFPDIADFLSLDGGTQEVSVLTQEDFEKKPEQPAQDVSVFLRNLTQDKTKRTSVLEGIRLCHQGNSLYGRPWITAWGRSSQVQAWVSQQFPQSQKISFQKLENLRIRELRPRVDFEITHETLPLEVGLVEAIAPNKGCYPGQEVIEKIVALGSPSKRLVQMSGEGTPPHLGDLIYSSSDQLVEVGRVTSVCRPSLETPEWLILGSLRKLYAKVGLEVQIGEQRSAKGGIIQVAPYTT